MYFHGDGWVMGDFTSHDRLVRQLAAGADTMVVFVDYSRAALQCARQNHLRGTLFVRQWRKYVEEHPEYSDLIMH